jgi:hypothetical protein
VIRGRGRRSAGLGLFWCVGHAHTTETIAECIRDRGIREAESNARLPDVVLTTAAASWDAVVTMERVDIQEDSA